MYEKPNPSDWSCLLSCVREDIVVVITIVVVGVDVNVGVVVVVVRANSHSPTSIRTPCAMVVRTPLEL
jgi:hypothetical protein